MIAAAILAGFDTGLAGATPLLERWGFVEGDLTAVEPHASCLLTSVHACGTLSDYLVEMAIDGGASLALVMPAKHLHKSFPSAFASSPKALLRSRARETCCDHDLDPHSTFPDRSHAATQSTKINTTNHILWRVLTLQP